MLAGRVLDQLLSKVRLVVLARLLAPEDFGLMGIALLFLATLESFSETGFSAAVIQKNRGAEEYLDVAWSFILVRGLLIAALIFLLAPVVGTFFEKSELVGIIRAIAFGYAARSFTNIGIVYFRKDLDFKRQVVYQASISAADFLTSIVAAFLLRGYWALVCGMLARNVAEVVASYALHPYRPRFTLDRAKVGELFRFGKWILLTNLLVFIATQGGDAFIAKMIGIGALGFYQMAFRLGNMVSYELAGVMAQVAFPVYARMQDDRARLKATFARALALNSFASVAVTAFIVAIARPGIALLLGEKWSAAVVPLQVLAVAGCVRSVTGTAGPLLLALGRTRLDFQLNLLRAIAFGAVVYPLTSRYAETGTAIAVLVGITVACVYVYNVLGVLGFLERGLLTKLAREAILPSSVMCGAMMLSEQVLRIQSMGVLIQVGGMAIGGLGIFTLMVRKIRPTGYVEIGTLVARAWPRRAA